MPLEDNELEHCLSLALLQDHDSTMSTVRGDESDDDDDYDDDDDDDDDNNSRRSSMFNNFKTFAQKCGKSFSFLKTGISKRKNARLQIQIISIHIAKRAMMENHIIISTRTGTNFNY